MTEEKDLLPAAAGFPARQAVAALRARNVPTGSLLKRAGLSESDIDNRERRIPALGQGKLLEYAAEALGDSEFGLHLAEQTDPREAGLAFYVASAAEDVGEALALGARYCRIVNEALRLKLIRSAGATIVEVEYAGIPRHFAWQNTLFAVAGLVKALRQMAGQDFAPAQAAFTLARSSGRREFERFFGCPVAFSASADRFGLSRETVALPLATTDRRLLETLQPICDEAASERGTGRGTLHSLVENEVQKLLPHGKASERSVAEALGMSARALSRKLTEEGAGYDEVVDGLRRSLALRYIREPSLTLAQIAWLLGYEGPGSFSHAFTRWTGKPPSEARDGRMHAGKAARPPGFAP